MLFGKDVSEGAEHAKTSPKSVDDFFHGVKNILVLSLKDCPFSEVCNLPVLLSVVSCRDRRAE